MHQRYLRCKHRVPSPSGKSGKIILLFSSQGILIGQKIESQLWLQFSITVFYTANTPLQEHRRHVKPGNELKSLSNHEF